MDMRARERISSSFWLLVYCLFFIQSCYSFSPTNFVVVSKQQQQRQDGRKQQYDAIESTTSSCSLLYQAKPRLNIQEIAQNYSRNPNVITPRPYQKQLMFIFPLFIAICGYIFYEPTLKAFEILLFDISTGTLSLDPPQPLPLLTDPTTATTTATTTTVPAATTAAAIQAAVTSSANQGTKGSAALVGTGLLTPTLNGPVMTSISILFATLIATTVSVLFDRQFQIRQCLIQEAEELRKLAIHIQSFPTFHRQEIAKALDYYLQYFFPNDTNKSSTSLKTKSDKKKKKKKKKKRNEVEESIIACSGIVDQEGMDPALLVLNDLSLKLQQQEQKALQQQSQPLPASSRFQKSSSCRGMVRRPVVIAPVLDQVDTVATTTTTTAMEEEAEEYQGEEAEEEYQDEDEYQDDEYQEDNDEDSSSVVVVPEPKITVPSTVLFAAYDCVANIQTQRASLRTNAQTTFPLLHYTILVLLASCIGLVFWLEVLDRNISQYNHTPIEAQFQMVWSVLVGIFAMVGTVLYDLATPFTGSYEITKGLEDEISAVRAYIQRDLD